MHDVIHAVAVSIAEDELMFNVHNVVDLEKGLEDGTAKDATVISLPYTDIQELPERLECPKLKTFLLFEKYGNSLQIPDPFFEEMIQLRVLCATHIQVPSLPSSLDCLLNLRTLLLINCCLLGDVAIVGKLKKLEILSFRGSDIEQLPSEIGQLTRLKLLDLGNCLKLEVIAQNVISKLSRLEELYMGNGFTQWEEVEGKSNASLIELKGLSKLRILEVHIRHVQSIRQDLVSVQLERFRIFIGEMWDWSGKYDTSRMLKFSGLGKNIYLGNEMRKLLTRTESLSLDKLDGVQNLFDELADGKGFINFTQLHSLTLRGLPQLTSSGFYLEISQTLSTIPSTSTEIVADDDPEDFNTILFNNTVKFPTLKKLKLSSLNVRKIWLDQFSAMSTAKNLRKLKVEECSRLKFLLSYSVVNSLVHLQELAIGKCESMLGIIETPELERDEEQMVFPKLEHLKLSDLPALTGFSIGINSQFPSLRELWIYKCPNLKRFISMSPAEEDNIIIKPLFDEKVGLPSLEELRVEKMDNLRKIWHHQLDSESFKKLRDLKVIDCHKLMNIFPLNIVMGRRFGRLEGLFMRWCNSIEEIIEEVVAEEFLIANSNSSRLDVFPQLISLELSNLPKLRSISQGAHIFEWPMLKNLWLFGCENVEILFASSEFSSRKTESKRPLFLVDRHKVAFPILRTLEVLMCAGLRNLVTLSAIESLGKLVRMKIIDSIMIEKIIEMQVEEEANEKTIRFSQLEYLELVSLPIIESFCSGNCTLEFPYLEKVVVSGCPSMKTFSPGALDTPKLHKLQLAEEERWEGDLNLTVERLFERMAKFSGLKYLKLSQFPQVREIWHDQILPVSFFNSLRWLVVDGCPFMLSAIPANLLRFLNNLEILEVRNCDSIEEVFHLEDLTADRYFGPLFPKLENLKLVDLPKLKRFCDFNWNISEMPKLDYLLIKSCSNMETFISDENLTRKKTLQEMTSADEELLADDLQSLFDKKVRLPSLEKLEISCMGKLRKIWRDELTSDSFCELKYLKIKSCEQLLNIFPRNMLERLQKLENLEVHDCFLVQEIVEFRESEVLDTLAGPSREAVPRFVFPNLTSLQLLNLPELQGFYRGNYILEWPMLMNLQMAGSSKVGILFASDSSSLQKMHKESQYYRMLAGSQLDYEDIFLRRGMREWMQPDYYRSFTPLFFIDTVRFQGLETLQISSMSNFRKLWQDELTSNSFSELKYLIIKQCHQLLSIFPRNMLERLQKLENLEVYDCDSIQVIVELQEINVSNAQAGPSKEAIHRLVLPKLTSLQLLNLPTLKSFYGGEYILEYPMLKNLRVERCDEVTILFASESLSLLEMHADSQHNFQTKPLFFVDKVAFSSLRDLDLCYMPQLLHLWKENSQPTKVFQNLQNLKIVGCGDLEKLVPSSMPLENLMTLEVSSCNRLKNLVTLKTAESLVKLVSIKIINCRTMAKIIEMQVGEEVKEHPNIIFSQLQYLKLDNLPRLECFYLGNYTLAFPSLEKVIMAGCLSMKIFSEGILSTPKLNNVQLSKKFERNGRNYEEYEEWWEGNLNSTIKKLFQEKAGFCCLRLKEIWPDEYLSIDSSDDLRELVVHDWPFTSPAIPTNLLWFLNNLENMEVRNCQSVEEVFHLEDQNADEHFGPLFPKLQWLSLEDLGNLKRFCNFNGNIIELLKLEFLWIKNCPNVETFISNPMSVRLTTNSEPQLITLEANLSANHSIQPLFDEKVRLPNLVRLAICGMDNMRKIWQDQFAMDSFCELETLQIEDCNTISNIFPCTMLGRLKKLEKLEVLNCDSVQGIVELTDAQVGAAVPSFVFPQLTSLTLRSLAKFKSFYPGVHISSWPLLKRLEVTECAEVEILASECLSLQETHGNSQHDMQITPQPLFFVDTLPFPILEELELSELPELLHLCKENACPSDVFQNLEALKISSCNKLQQLMPSFLSFQNLETLSVYQCDGLVDLVPIITAKSLVQLRTMKIIDCKMIQEIIREVGEEVENDCIVFSHLKYLRLDCLPSLSSFYSGNHILEFPSLQKVIVRNCPNMEIFSRGFLSTPLLQRVQQNDSTFYNVRWEGSLNSTIQKLFEEKSSKDEDSEKFFWI